jgi:peptide/nickel transport system permease protein
MGKENTGRKTKNRNHAGLVWFRFKKNKLAMFGLVMIILLMILSLGASLYIPYENVYKQNIADRFITPGAGRIFGTDQFGRDLFARIMYGGRISLSAGLVTVGIAFVAGLFFGGTAGYFGGRIDNILMRICDVFMAVPQMLLAMAVVAALGQGTFKMLVALSVASFPRYARTVRASILTLRGQEYVEAAKCCGAGSARIIVKHIIPNGLAPLIVSATFGLGSTILSIASLGFLGIGIASPTPEWGTILSENRINIRYYPHLGLIPGVFIMIAVICLNFIGDGVRDAMDPRTKN